MGRTFHAAVEEYRQYWGCTSFTNASDNKELRGVLVYEGNQDHPIVALDRWLSTCMGISQNDGKAGNLPRARIRLPTLGFS
jgi:hypothetical protein